MNTIESLVYTSVFSSSDEEKRSARTEIRAIAQQRGIYSASIHDIYMKCGRDRFETCLYTVPAFNVRNLTYDFSRNLFHFMKERETGLKHNNMVETGLKPVSTIIFEIARGEVGYTGQTHDEYVTSVLAGAIAAEWVGPVYLQADHTQFSAEKYKQDPAGQLEVLKQFIKKAVDAGVYNIDIDASTLVDLSKTDLNEQQKENAHMTAELLTYIRTIEPEGITISVGGEIGHIGGKNSTVADFIAFMQECKKTLHDSRFALQGLSKVSVQTGTSHGGIILPDGSIQEAQVDFSVIESIGKVAREQYKMGGVVQHGASTLPTTLFSRFPEAGTLEIHLATGLQNIIFKHMAPELKKEIYKWLDVNCSGERKEGQTDEQFHYITRKKANGFFKEKIWKMDEPYKQEVMKALDREVRLIINSLFSYEKN